MDRLRHRIQWFYPFCLSNYRCYSPFSIHVPLSRSLHPTTFHEGFYNYSPVRCNNSSSKLSPSSRAWLQRQQKDPYVQQANLEGSPSRSIYKLQQMDTMVYDYLKGKVNNDRKRKSSSVLVENEKEERNQIHRLFHKGNVVIELGASPGGWTLYASKCIGKEGFIIACDLLQLDPLCLQSIQENSKLEVIYGDFTKSDIQYRIITALEQTCNRRTQDTSGATERGSLTHGKVDCIISDMAVSFSGDRSTDALRTMNLCENALSFAIGHDGTTDDDSIILKKGGSFLCKFFPCGKMHEQYLLHRIKKNFRYTTLLKPPASRKDSSEMYLFAGDYVGVSYSTKSLP